MFTAVRSSKEIRCSSRILIKIRQALSIVPSNASPLNWKILIASTLGIFALSLHTTSIYSFITQLLRDLGTAETNVPYYAGLASSGFYSGAFVGSNLCGCLCDRIGRRPVLLVCLFISIVTSIYLAFVPNYACLVSARVIAGLISGSFATFKAVIGDVSDDSNVAVGFSLYAVGWSTSVMVGALIGGMLSEPVKKYPAIFGLDCLVVFSDRPYLLPCLVVSSINALAFVLCIFALDETKGLLIAKKRQIAFDVSSDKGLRSDRESLGEADDFNNNREKNRKESRVRKISHPSLPAFQDVSIITQSLAPLHSCPAIPSSDGWDSPGDVGVESRRIANEASPLLKHAEPSVLHVLRQRGPLIAMCMYGLYSFINVCLDETTPVWVATNPIYGGLNFTTSEIGMLTGSPAFFIVLLSLYLAPLTLGIIGAKKAFIFGMLTVLVTIPMFISVNLIIPDPSQKNHLLYYLAVVWIILKLGGALSFISLSCICNNCVPRCYIGIMNGVATSISYFTRILGPSFAGSVLSWSLSPTEDGSKKPFPLDYHFVYFCLDAVVFLVMVVAFFSPRSCDIKR